MTIPASNEARWSPRQGAGRGLVTSARELWDSGSVRPHHSRFNTGLPERIFHKPIKIRRDNYLKVAVTDQSSDCLMCGVEARRVGPGSVCSPVP